jgi:non-ribosomal peptide synthetase component F
MIRGTMAIRYITDNFTARIFAANGGTEVTLQETSEGLELTADVGDQETTVVLHPEAVRKLRLALARYERKSTGQSGSETR